MTDEMPPGFPGLEKFAPKRAARRMFRYTVPVDDQAWTFDLTGDPVAVAGGATLDEVESWAEHTDGAAEDAAPFPGVRDGPSAAAERPPCRDVPASERPGLAPVRDCQRRGGCLMTGTTPPPPLLPSGPTWMPHPGEGTGSRPAGPAAAMRSMSPGRWPGGSRGSPGSHSAR